MFGTWMTQACKNEGGCCESGKVEFLGSSVPLKLWKLAGVWPGRLALLHSPTCKKKRSGRL